MSFEQKREFIRLQRAEGYKDKSLEELKAMKADTDPREKIELDAINLALKAKEKTIG